jgi:phosphomevalonate kinase
VRTASAPGKVVLLGEYAVVEGGRALCSAVTCRATGELQNQPSNPSPVLRDVFREAEKKGLRLPPGVHVDTAAFRDSAGRKLGLGSSAAAAVVCAGLLSGVADEDTYKMAIEGHRNAQGGSGSGIDVATSFSGGVIAASRQPGFLRKLTSNPFPDLRWLVLFTGESADTRTFLERCRASREWASAVAHLGTIADEGVAAYDRAESPGFLEAVRSYARGLDRLGSQAGVPIVTDEMRTVIERIEEVGGAAKPSGAGGGDVMVAWVPKIIESELGRLLMGTRLRILPIEVEPRGLCVSG